MSDYSKVIKNARIIDGTGNPWYKGDVGIAGEKIKYIGNIKDPGEAEVIDAKGLVLAPGFVDMHGHSDLCVFHDSTIYNKLEQGVTTEVAGFCGLTTAPVSEKYFTHLKKYIGFTDDGLKQAENWEEFTTFGRYMDATDALALGPNVAFYVGQGTIRISVMGFDNRPATPDELEKMKVLVAEAMESGALGLSTGLIYAPGVYTPKEEIVELCKVVKIYGGSYASHLRNESYDVVNSVKEAIDIGRQAEIPVLISHHKIGGIKNWGASQETLRLVDEANQEGVEVCLDQYPYKAGSTMLSIVIPPEFHEGGTSKLIERLKDDQIRLRIKEHIQDTTKEWENFILHCGAEGILMFTSEALPEAHGRYLADYAKEKGMDPIDAVIDVLITTDGAAGGVYFMMGDEDIERIMQHPCTMIGTDGAIVMGGGGGHPRAMGTFTKVLGRYVREKQVLRLEDAIRKMTSLPAIKAGFKTKGLVKEGFDADLVVFNPDTVIDRADYQNAALPNEGIEYVFVNGEMAVKKGKFTGQTAGKLIRVRK